MKNYIPRIIDNEIEKNLEVMGAINIRGPKWCGKTTTAEHFSKSIFKVQGDAYEGKTDNNKILAEENPYLALKGEKPRTIDEWQLVPELWNAIRNSVDNIGKPGQYILTGSATPEEKKTEDLHSGAGRFAFINMKPMTLFESNDSNGTISLKDLFNHNDDIDGKKSDITFEKMAYLIARGGWPQSLQVSEKGALIIPKNYIEAVVNSDISKIDGVSRNPDLARAILRAYSRHVSTIDSDNSIIADAVANFGEASRVTITDYITQLKKLFLIDEIPAWNPNIRSKTAIRSTNKKSFVDPSIAVAALSVTPEEIIYDMNTFGLLFENLVDRDLSVYIESIEGSLNHYRDRYGLEADQILKLNNGKYALVETKLGATYIPEAEEHLLNLERLIEENEPRLGKPEFLMIVTCTNTAYTTKNGVKVVPIGCLKN